MGAGRAFQGVTPQLAARDIRRCAKPAAAVRTSQELYNTQVQWDLLFDSVRAGGGRSAPPRSFAAALYRRQSLVGARQVPSSFPPYNPNARATYTAI